MKVALTVPVLPSVTVTSLMLSEGAGSSSRMVPRPWPSAMVALTGRCEVDQEGLVGFVQRVALDGDGDRLGRLARREGQRARGRSPCSRAGASPCRSPSRSSPSPSGRSAAESVTVKVALTVPLLPSVTDTSLIDQRGRRIVVDDGAEALCRPRSSR